MKQIYAYVIILISGILFGCDKPPKLEKPFVIVGKSHIASTIDYVYQDSNGHRESFETWYTDSIQYNIGDTLR